MTLTSVGKLGTVKVEKSRGNKVKEKGMSQYLRS